MDEEEGYEHPRDDEMDRTRRLASAEQVEQPRRGGVDPRRHGEPGREHQRQQDKDDADVTEFLEDVVARRRRARRIAQSRVVLDVAPDVSPRPFGAADVKILAAMRGKNRPPQVSTQEYTSDL